MRMRKKPNLLPRLERVSSLFAEEPEALAGRWLEAYPGYRALHIELGCGKGRFTAGTAGENPDVLLAAVERVPDALVVAMERVKSLGLGNARFIAGDAGRIRDLFGPGEAERLYINFCDPWPKSRDAKHRLTAPNFLRSYATVLRSGGQVWFKTDNRPLFDWSLAWFEKEGWTLVEVTNDLHAGGVSGILTDYEEKFLRQGLAINRLAAAKTAATRTAADGETPRLRNAGLSDARGYADSRAVFLKNTEDTP